MEGAGWVIPMAYLISNERMRGYGCDSLQAAAQSFTKGLRTGSSQQVISLCVRASC